MPRRQVRPGWRPKTSSLGVLPAVVRVPRPIVPIRPAIAVISAKPKHPEMALVEKSVVAAKAITARFAATDKSTAEMAATKSAAEVAAAKAAMGHKHGGSAAKSAAAHMPASAATAAC